MRLSAILDSAGFWPAPEPALRPFVDPSRSAFVQLPLAPPAFRMAPAHSPVVGGGGSGCRGGGREAAFVAPALVAPRRERTSFAEGGHDEHGGGGGHDEHGGGEHGAEGGHDEGGEHEGQASALGAIGTFTDVSGAVALQASCTTTSSRLISCAAFNIRCTMTLRVQL